MKKIFFPMLIFLFLFSSKGNSQATYSLDVTDYGSPSTSAQFNGTEYSINGMVEEYSGLTGQPSIHIAIIDSSTCQPLSNCNNYFGQVNMFYDPDSDCVVDPNTYYSNPNRPRPENYFIWRSDDIVQMQTMAHFLDLTEIGNWIIAYSWYPNAYSTMDTSFRNVFHRLGSVILDTLSDNMPFIFFCKKGDAASIMETSGTAPNSLITVSTTYSCSPTAVEEINNYNTISVFPNPASEKFEIRNLQLGIATTITIYDVIGNVVQSEIKNHNSEMSVDVHALPSGFYFVKVTSGDYNVEGKICLMR